MKAARSVEVRNPSRATSVRLAEIEAVLRDEIAAESQGPHQAVERMRALHPKLNIETIKKRLDGTGPDHPSRWVNPDFWRDEIDLALLEGVQFGSREQHEAIARIRALWPKLSVEVLQDRMEEVATNDLPAYLRDDFWAGALDGILLAGLKQGSQGAKAAVNKVLKIRPELRVEVIQRRLRQLARRVPQEKVRRGVAFPWTPELDARLMELCRQNGLRVAVTELRKETGWPRHVICRRAHKLGIPSQDHHERHWTAAERKYVVERVNHRPVESIAKALGRSVKSVWRKIEEMGLSGRREEGYSLIRLARDLHIRPATIRTWIKEKRLKRGRDGHIKERTLIAFFRDHGHKLRLNELEPDIQSLILDCLGPNRNERESATGSADSDLAD